MKLLLTTLSLILFLTGHAQTATDAVNDYITKVMRRNGIPGAAVAVLQRDTVTFQQYYGLADQEGNRPVDAQTLFKLHSLSKVFVATAIFQLEEEGKLQLADSIGRYLQGLPREWQSVQIRHLLSHSSGLPDIVRYEAASETEHRKKVYADSIAFEPGERFQYNQSNFWLLNRIIREVSDTDLERFLIRRQFGGNSMALVFAQDATAINRAVEYFVNTDGEMAPKEFNVPEYLYGAAGIAITMNDFIQWNKDLDNDGLLSVQNKSAMWSPFQYREGPDFAYGWARETINGRSVIGFSGGTIVSLRKYAEDDMTVIILTNGYRHFPDINRVANYIAGLVDVDLSSAHAQASEALVEQFLKQPLQEALVFYRELVTQKPDMQLEGALNAIGYQLAARKKNAEAIAVFKLNTEEHPNSWNVWDSLGEGYEMKGDTINAVKYYQKSVDLNPKNQHGIDKLELLRE